VYDIHHHRCLPDTLSIEEVTKRCVQSWKQVRREPYFHISSPRNGYQSKNPQPHADYISFADFPDYWLTCAEDIDITIDVEAKAKELAVQRLLDNLAQSSPPQIEVAAP
jgi:UV DNA damage endonuclease